MCDDLPDLRMMGLAYDPHFAGRLKKPSYSRT
jgi:hypothetical protein